MNLSTVLAVIIIAAAALAALRYVMRHGLDDCGGNCSSCGHGCSRRLKKGLAQARRELAEEKKNGSV